MAPCLANLAVSFSGAANPLPPLDHSGAPFPGTGGGERVAGLVGCEQSATACPCTVVALCVATQVTYCRPGPLGSG